MVPEKIALQSLQFPIQVKVMTKQETQEYHVKKLYELSLKSLGEIPQLEEPTYKEKIWVLHRLKQPPECWTRWFVGKYFTEEQTPAMGLTDENIAGRGIK